MTRGTRDVIFVGWLILTLVLVLALRFAYHSYEDRNKTDTFTVVSVIRDFNALSAHQVQDKMRHAFTATALRSWANVVVGPNILVFADSDDTCDYIGSLVRGARCVLIDCWDEDTHKPLLSCIFGALPVLVQTDSVAFVNGDINIEPSLPFAIDAARKRYAERPWLMAGAKVSVEVKPGMLDEYNNATAIAIRV